MLKTEPRALHMPGRGFVTEPHFYARGNRITVFTAGMAAEFDDPFALCGCPHLYRMLLFPPWRDLGTGS